MPKLQLSDSRQAGHQRFTVFSQHYHFFTQSLQSFARMDASIQKTKAAS
jgi:hypothetical protein